MLLEVREAEDVLKDLIELGESGAARNLGAMFLGKQRRSTPAGQHYVPQGLLNRIARLRPLAPVRIDSRKVL